MSALAQAPQRRKVLAFIQAEVTAGRDFPTPRAITEHMGWTRESSAKACLSTLAGLDRVLTRTVVGRQTVYALWRIHHG